MNTNRAELIFTDNTDENNEKSKLNLPDKTDKTDVVTPDGIKLEGLW